MIMNQGIVHLVRMQNFPKNLYLPRYADERLRISGYEILVFWRVVRTK